MTERWRPIPDFPKYEASDLGQIRSLYGRSPARQNKPRVLKPSTYGPEKRLKVALGAKHQRTIHRLVLETFVGPKPIGMECRHLDGNPTNNRLSNLAWGTPKENAADQRCHGTNAIHERHGMVKLTTLEVTEIRALTPSEIELVPQKLLAELYGISQATLSRIRSGKLWTVGRR